MNGFRAAFLALLALTPVRSEGQEETGFRLAAFRADVTPPVGHMLFTGRWRLAEGVTSPLEARGFALFPPEDSGQKPIVWCSVDWSEIRNDAYDRWRDALARVAGTDRERVLVSAIHQHDTPLADLEAERILRQRNSPHHVIDLEFHEKAVASVATALHEAMVKSEPVTHLGTGAAKIEGIASNRRYLAPDGTVHYNRMSTCKDLTAQRAPEGDIDPRVKTLSFWNGDKPLCALSVYATHPMSYYGTGKTDADFPGLARSQRQTETPGCLQIYASGCGGNVTAGKFNDGRPENRPLLAERLRDGMSRAFAATRRVPLDSIGFRLEKLRLEPRNSPGFTEPDLEKEIAEKTDARSHCMAAIGLSWRKRADDPGHRIDVPLVSFNNDAALLLLLPGEIYVEYQLYARDLAPDSFVVTAGYGESAAGYLPIERAWAEDDSNLRDWCWVAEGMEERVKRTIRKLVAP